MALMTDSPWPGLLLWAGLYITDYAFTLASARMYHGGVCDILVYEGSFELNPAFEKDVDARRRISPRFVLALLWSGVLLSKDDLGRHD